LKISDLIGRLDVAIEKLRAASLFDATKTFPVTGLTEGISGDSLEQELSSLLVRLRTLNEEGIEISRGDVVCHGGTVLTLLSNFEGYVSNAINNPANTGELFRQFVIFRNSLRDIDLFVASPADKTLSRVASEANARAISAAAKTEQGRVRITKALEETKAISLDISAKQTEAIRLQAELSSLHSKGIESSASIDRVLAKVQDLSTTHAVLEASKTKLEADLAEDRKRIVVLLNDAKSLKEETIQRLEDATKVGLAQAFTQREEKSRTSFNFWARALAFSLLLMFGAAKYLVDKAPEKAAAIDQLIYWLTHIPITIPFVWIAWFASKQASYALRLSEDYAFKAASALSLQAYKGEAQAVDPELVKKLLDIAVTNFGENPLRIFEPKSIPATPLADLLKDKDVMSSIRDGLKALPDFIKKAKP
jgi:hypothetical protein